MRSIPLTIGWEMLRRGRWGMLLAICGANALPVFLFAALLHDGATDTSDVAYIIMQSVLIEMNLFVFGISVFGAIGPVSRLYTYPISTSTIVAWHLLLGMAAVAAEVIASTALLNVMFGLGWALWGPALFAAVTVAAIQAALWLTEKSGWVVAALTAVGVFLSLWLKSRYGPLFTTPEHYWTAVTPGEATTLIIVAILAYFVGVYGVSRNRRGEPPYSIGLIAWVDSFFLPSPEAGHRFQNPAQAQFWFEWQKKGWAMPGMVVMGALMAVFIWLTASRNPTALFEGFLAGGAILSMGCFLGGILFGNVGANDADPQIGHFLGTRPMTSAELARIVLKMMAKSVFIAWVMWVVAFAGLYGILLALRVNFQAALPEQVGWWYFPATLVGAWTTAGVFASIMLTGRRGLAGALVFAMIAVTLGGTLIAKNWLSPQAQDYLLEGGLFSGGIGFAAYTVWVFAKARSRLLIGGPTLYFAATAWAALCALLGFVSRTHSTPGLAILVFVAGVFALSVAPLASAPLALTWNRNR